MSSVIKDKSEPSLLFVSIFALITAGVGGLTGFIYLMSFSSKAYSSVQERAAALEDRESTDSIPGDAFYIEGPTLRSNSWQTKRQQLIDGSAPTIRVTAEEINAWMEAKFRPAVVQTDEENNGLMLQPDRPNVGITREGTTYLNLPTEISGYGIDGNYVLSAQVRYASGAPTRLLIDHLQIGGAAVPLPRILGAKIVSSILEAFSGTEEYPLIRQAWSRVRSVEIAEGALVLSLDTP